MITALMIVLFLICLYFAVRITKTAPETKRKTIILSVLLVLTFVLPLFFIYELLPIKQGAIPFFVYSIFYLALIFYISTIKGRR